MDYEYDGVEDEFGGRILWGRIGILGVALLFMFAFGRCTAGGGVAQEDFDLLASEREQLATENAQQEALIQDLQDRIEDFASQSGGQTTTTPTPGATQGTTVPTPGATGTPAAGPVEGSTYVVQEGDTLSGIAEAVYGDPQLFQIIADANGITEGLTIGQTLTIPPRPQQ